MVSLPFLQFSNAAIAVWTQLVHICSPLPRARPLFIPWTSLRYTTDKWTFEILKVTKRGQDILVVTVYSNIYSLMFKYVVL